MVRSMGKDANREKALACPGTKGSSDADSTLDRGGEGRGLAKTSGRGLKEERDNLDLSSRDDKKRRIQKKDIFSARGGNECAILPLKKKGEGTEEGT